MTMLVLLSLLGCPACDDADGDEVCDDVDLCVGDDAVGDGDADGVCDDGDVCAGDDVTGDADADGICDDIDVCSGDDATGDADADGICDDMDVCSGDDATGDTDGDSVCDDTDICAGDDATGDSDSDGDCDDTDLCLGDNATGDVDGDGVCNDQDVCPLDDPDDTDGDGVCDTMDGCPLDNPDDTDGDGVCDSDDVCPGASDNSDGSCTMVLEALSTQDAWASMESHQDNTDCPTTTGGNIDGGWGEEIAALQSHLNGSNPFENRAALSFDTSGLPGSAVVQSASLAVTHNLVIGVQVPVQLWGGPQPIYGPAVDSGDFNIASALLAAEDMAQIVTGGAAQFDVPVTQINKSGLTQFMLRLDQDCPIADESLWGFNSPESPANPPTMIIHYLP